MSMMLRAKPAALASALSALLAAGATGKAAAMPIASNLVGEAQSQRLVQPARCITTSPSGCWQQSPQWGVQQPAKWGYAGKAQLGYAGKAQWGYAGTGNPYQLHRASDDPGSKPTDSGSKPGTATNLTKVGSGSGRGKIPPLGHVPQPSDLRLKQDIVPLARLDNGIGLYRFRYRGGDPTTYVGVMAQEVVEIAPSAVIRGRDGYLRVDYDRLGLEFMTWDEWMARQGTTSAPSE